MLIHLWCCVYKYFIPLYCRLVFHCMDMSKFVYRFSYWYKFEFFSSFWLLESSYEQSCTGLYVNTYFNLFSKSLGAELLACIISVYFNLIRNCQTVVQNGCTTLHFHQNGPRVREDCSTSSHALGTVSLFDADITARLGMVPLPPRHSSGICLSPLLSPHPVLTSNSGEKQAKAWRQGRWPWAAPSPPGCMKNKAKTRRQDE